MIHFISDAFAAQGVNDVVRNDLALFEGLTKIEEVQKVSSGQISVEFLENSKNDLFALLFKDFPNICFHFIMQAIDR